MNEADALLRRAKADENHALVLKSVDCLRRLMEFHAKLVIEASRAVADASEIERWMDFVIDTIAEEIDDPALRERIVRKLQSGRIASPLAPSTTMEQEHVRN